MTSKLFFIILFCLVTNGCVNTFILSDESRLPKWFELSSGENREDVKVRISYTVWPWGREAKLVMDEGCCFSSKSIKFNLSGEVPLVLDNNPNTRYPSYEILRGKGTIDIVEHKEFSNYFYMTDDPSIWNELVVETK